MTGILVPLRTLCCCTQTGFQTSPNLCSPGTRVCFARDQVNSMSPTCLHLVPTLKICVDDKMLNSGTSIVRPVWLLPTNNCSQGYTNLEQLNFVW